MEPAPVRLAFAFTDIEGSTRLLERLQGRYGEVLATHAGIVRTVARAHRGREVDTHGDASFLVFPAAADACGFAAEVQHALADRAWPEGIIVRTRIGVHVGEALPSRTGFVGLDVHLGARVAAAAHGGQALVTRPVADGIAGLDGMPATTSLGTFSLKDIRGPIELLQLQLPDTPAGLPPPRTLDEVEEPPEPGVSPYPGLVAFEEADAARFFGREEVVGSLVRRLAEDRFLAIVGASGSGKSSVVRAGLVPALRAWGATRIALLTPTDDPVRAIDGALEASSGSPSVMVVDQLEELFAPSHEDGSRARFVERLLRCVDAGMGVVVVLRADFYDRLADFEGLRTLVAEHQAYLGSMGPEDVRRAIEGPAEQGGWRLDPGLVDLIIHDLGDEPGSLPLLSHALRETWMRRRGRRLTLRGYLDSGGVQGAIARTADQVIETLPPPDLARTRSIFLRLTELGTETPDTRRRAPLGELLGPGGDGAERQVLDRLVAARLVVADDRTAEVAHEALIREWPQLREWLDEDRANIRLHRQVTEAAAEWEQADRDPSLLFRGARLATATEWLRTHAADANELERAFVAASGHAVAVDAAERDAARERELEAARRATDAERRRADAEGRSARRTRRAAVALVGLAAVAGAAAGYALLQQQEADRSRATAVERQQAAEEQQRLSLSRQLAAEGLAAIEDIPRGSLLALAAKDVSDTPEAASSTLSLLTTQPGLVRSLWPGQDVHQLVLADDGRTLHGALTTGGRVIHWDLGDGSVTLGPVITELLDTDRGLFTISPDGTRAVTNGMGAGTAVWDLGTGEAVARVPASPMRIGFSPDGRLVTIVDERGASLRDATTGELLVDLALPKASEETWPYEMAVDPTATWVAMSSWDGLVMLWDRASGTGRQLVAPNPDVIDEMAFARDGSMLALGSSEGVLSLYDTTSGQPIGTPADVADAGIDHLSFGRDASLAYGFGNEVRVRDVVRGVDVGAPLTLGGDGLGAMAFAADGHTLALANTDGRVGVWDLERAHPLATTVGRLPGAVDQGAQAPSALTSGLSRDGSMLASGTTTGEVTIWDVATGAPIAGPFLAHPPDPARAEQQFRPGVQALVFSHDGTMLASSGGDGTLRRWDPRTGAPIGEPARGHDMSASIGEIALVAFSPDDRVIASSGTDERILLWDAATGERIGQPMRLLTPEEIEFEQGVLFLDHAFRDIAFSPDGRVLAASGVGSVFLWDVATQEPLGDPVGPHDAQIRAVAISADGTTLAVTDDDGGVTLWSLPDRRSLGVLHGVGRLWGVVSDPGGSLLLTQGERGIQLWDLAHRRRIGGPIAVPDHSVDAWFTGDDGFVASYLDGRVLAWDLDPATQRAVACARAGRDLSAEEWAAAMGDVRFRMTCPGPVVTLPAGTPG